MPLDGGVSALFTEEYYRFVRGIRNLDPDTRRSWEQALKRQGLKPGEAATISIPAWNDIIQFGPRLQTSREERREFWTALREKRAPNLAPDVVEAITKQAAFTEALRTSAAPSYLRGFADIMTAIDNVQDFASTVATLGRLTIWAAPRVAGRLVPGVGWVLNVSDLLNLINFVGMLAVPIYAALCHGPTAGVQAGVPGFVFKRALKSQVWAKALQNPFSRRGRPSGDIVGDRIERAARDRELLAGRTLDPTDRARQELAAKNLRAELRLRTAQRFGKLPNVWNLLEVFQTTQALWGYGLSLGGLVGTFFETTFAAQRLLDGEKVRLNNTGIFGPLWRSEQRIGGSGRRVTTENAQQAAGVLAGAAKLQQVQDVLPDELHMLTMLALAGAIPTLADLTRDVDWRPAFWDAFPMLWAPVIQDDPFREGFLAAHRDRPPLTLGHAVPGNPALLGGYDYVETLAPLCTDAMTEYLARRRDTGAGALYGTLVNQTFEHFMLFLTGDDEAIRWELSTDQRLLASLCEEGYLMRSSEPHEKLWRFWTRARLALEADDATRLPPETWLRFAAEAGITLIKLLPPESPWPPEWDAYVADTPGIALVRPPWQGGDTNP